ncbi:hypothetical protein V7S43_018243 [Phytophthora oleae]|uniref:Crinkler effector protein N-terminal domain-containing protein n=1 Tax=Phytophthora oleae TaxID=2107226 RepID=A0ABD3EU33_9STRA
MKLSCAVVGETGSVFEVDIDAGASVSALKKVIQDQSGGFITVPWLKLQLFLAKKRKAWLSDDKTRDAVLQSGDVALYKEMRGSWKLNDLELFGSGVLPPEKVVHVLVVVPPEFPPRKKQKVGDVEVMHFTTNEQAELDAICKLGQGLTREALIKGALLKFPQSVLRVNLSGGLYVR